MFTGKECQPLCVWGSYSMMSSKATALATVDLGPELSEEVLVLQPGISSPRRDLPKVIQPYQSQCPEA